jgi:hypothetical protein
VRYGGGGRAKFFLDEIGEEILPFAVLICKNHLAFFAVTCYFINGKSNKTNMSRGALMG